MAVQFEEDDGRHDGGSRDEDPDPSDMDPDDDDRDDDLPTTACPHCGEEIYEFADDCPACGRSVSDADHRRGRTNHPIWVILTAAAIVILMLYGATRWIF